MKRKSKHYYKLNKIHNNISTLHIYISTQNAQYFYTTLSLIFNYKCVSDPKHTSLATLNYFVTHIISEKEKRKRDERLKTN